MTGRVLDAYDLVLCDLDGVLYAGRNPIADAPETIASVTATGVPVKFLTNNASRTPDDVAAHLGRLGITADAEQVVTSAQVAAGELAKHHPAGAPVLVIGGKGLIKAVTEAGLAPVFSADEHPAAVVQGFDKALGWRQLAEAAHAVNAGVPWTATNTDVTLPTERGPAPGNGTLVDVVAQATGVTPRIAGKPQPVMFRHAIRRTGADRPIMVGDRLDTDIAGASAAGIDTLFVLTGVDRFPDTFSDGERPTYVHASVAGLLQPGMTPDAYAHQGARS